MPYAIKSVKHLNALEIKFNGSNSTECSSKFFRFMETHQHYQEDDYTYYIPLPLLDEWLNAFGYVTTMTETVDSIKGIEKNLTPIFPLVTRHLDKMKLTPFAYQKVGISFLVEQERGIIGDEMGLGKTLQALGAAYYLYHEGKIKKALIICPSAVKYQWLEEIEKFTEFSAMVVDGTKKKQAKIIEDWRVNDEPFLLVNYELVRNNIEAYETLPFDCVVLDEAHRIKNRESLITQAIKRLDAKYRFALTGTPMQNKPEEAFALMSWINPDVFGGITNFRKKHIVVGSKYGRKFIDLGYKNLDEIRDSIAPYLLRRMKKDVASELPEIIHKNVFVEMNGPQKAVYRAIQEDVEKVNQQIQEVYRTSPEAQTNPHFKAPQEDQLQGYRYMQIACSDHPHLLLQSSSGMAKKYFALLKKCKTSPKLEELISTLQPLLEDGHKIIIFSTYVSMLKIISDRLQATFNQVPFYIAGEVSAKERQEQIVAFRESNDRKIMLLSDAGNFGLNLQFCDILINYDLPWNPAVIDQRYGRIHRIGSTYSQVTMIDFATLGTIDETIMKSIERKRGINTSLIEKSEKEISYLQDQLKGAQ